MKTVLAEERNLCLICDLLLYLLVDIDKTCCRTLS